MRAAFEISRLRGDEKVWEPDPARVHAVIRGYVDAGGVPGQSGPGALAAVLGIMLSRVSWFMWQSLGHRACSDEDREWATAYIPQGLDKLRRRYDDRDRLASLVLA